MPRPCPVATPAPVPCCAGRLLPCLCLWDLLPGRSLSCRLLPAFTPVLRKLEREPVAVLPGE